MTSEKAIELLHRLQDEQFDGEYGDERRKALEMAVRALSGDGDTISRQQAIDAVVSAMIDGADAELVEGVMELLPSAQPQWIPSSERLPEHNQKVLAYYADIDRIMLISYNSHGITLMTAWMPLPEPYGGG